ncbi:MAG: alanine--glyoxylate aminotransferase family protein [Armatimonadota bacterium]|nr:alanine--glyoxylate aminotransferase family protein [Armatimonadota bacterium]MDR5702959.1 alanine--glyoxylate aminotransferase family protein [Armatimonadota bacterium]MDR7434800.1 alanine--glyoxylate aminotransferase family protein [Armatimonadota bacterium]
MEQKYLLIPGPTPLPPEVLEATGQQMINHRSPSFAGILRRVIEGAREVFQTNHDVLPLTSSGTGGLEAAVVNTLSPGDVVLSLSCGFFGDRFADIAEAYGARVERITVEWGKPIPPEVVADRLRRDRKGEIKAILVTHNDTSTGVTNDVRAISEARENHPALLLVDGVSAVGAMDCQTDAWGLDVVVTASQKALMSPPGIALVAVGPRAWEAVQHARMPRYYFDFHEAKRYLERPVMQTPFTPAISVVYALDVALARIRQVGLANWIARHALMARATRAGVRGLGLSLLAEEPYASNAVTAVRVPEGVDVRRLIARLKEEHGVVVAGGQGPLEGKIFRIGHLGYVEQQDILAVLAALEEVLPELGFPVERGMGVKAAEKVFATTVEVPQ